MNPQMEFKDLKLNKQLLNAIEDRGYQKPSPIQEKAIPPIHSGQDLIGIAQTGTGKTAAYVLPLLMKLKYAQGEDPRALVLAPTRELAIQIAKEIEGFSTYLDLRTACFYGGTGTKEQLAEIRNGLDIIVATPGRLLDLYKSGELYTKQIKTIILDEADRMMDMGFMPQINRILELLPMKKQCLLFSATFSDKVEQLAGDFVEFPVKIEISPQATTAETIEQRLFEVPNNRTKIEFLHHLMNGEFKDQKIIVFAKTKKSANDIFKFIERKTEIPVGVIHANKSQNTRLNTIARFKENEIQVLVATDVSARGIDISDVAAVINFNIPLHYEDYVHRVGRTGRAEKDGIAVSMANKSEMIHIEEIEKLIGQKIPLKLMPTEIEVFDTPFEEKQEIERELDRIKRKRDPNFKGAFHDKSDKKQKKSFKKKRR